MKLICSFCESEAQTELVISCCCHVIGSCVVLRLVVILPDRLFFFSPSGAVLENADGELLQALAGGKLFFRAG